MNIPAFDPSKMDPKVLMEVSQLIQKLPPDQLSRMQGMMHNMMAGFDVSSEMENFEKSLPAEFRNKLSGLMGRTTGMTQTAPSPVNGMLSAEEASPPHLHEARLTILKGVASGHVSPEDAEQLLFSSGQP